MSLSIIITYESNHGLCQVMHVCITIIIIIIIISSSSNSDFLAQDDDDIVSKHIGNGLGTSNRAYWRVLDNVRERNRLESPEWRIAKKASDEAGRNERNVFPQETKPVFAIVCHSQMTVCCIRNEDNNCFIFCRRYVIVFIRSRCQSCCDKSSTFS